MHCISCAFLKKKCRKTSVVQANSKVTFHVPGLSTLQFSCQKITRPWKTILSGLAGSLSFVVSLLSCAFSHAHGRLCVSGILLDRPRKKRLLIVYLQWCNFCDLLVCSADLDILCSRSFSQYLKFYSFKFIHKISTRVVCVNEASQVWNLNSDKEA